MISRIAFSSALVCLCASWALAQVPPAIPAPKPAVPAPAAAPAPAPDAPAPDAAAPGAPEAPPFKVRIVPQSISINASVNFDEQGRPQNEYQNFNLSMQLIVEGKTNVNVCRNLQIDKLVTDTGEALKPDANNMPREFNMGRDPFNRHMGGNQNRFSFGMQLPMPTRPATNIAEFSGSVEVEYSTGVMKQAVLEPFCDFEGKRTRISEIPDSLVIISRPDAKTTKIELSNKLFGQLSAVRFYDENGREMNVNGWGGGGGGATTYRQFQMTMPDKGKVSMEFFPQVKTFRIPFTIKKIQLPKLNSQQAIDAVVEAHDMREIPLKPAGVEVLKAQVERIGG